MQVLRAVHDRCSLLGNRSLVCPAVKLSRNARRALLGMLKTQYSIQLLCLLIFLTVSVVFRHVLTAATHRNRTVAESVAAPSEHRYPSAIYLMLMMISKPDTVEKLLSRLNKSTIRNEVIAALSNSVDDNGGSDSASPQPPTPLQHSSLASTRAGSMPQNTLISYLDCHQPAYSPLEILAAAVATQRHPSSSADASQPSSQQPPTLHDAALSPALHSHQPSPETLAADKMIELYFSKLCRSDITCLQCC